MVWRFHNCIIRLEYSFVLMLAWALLRRSGNVLFLLLFALAHEAGHLAVLLLFGGKPRTLTLAFYGIGMQHDAPLDRGEELLFLLGGPAVNGLFALLGVFREGNLLLLLLNLLPLYPLDGGRAAALFCSKRVSVALSALSLALLAALGVYCRSLPLLLIALYLAVFGLQEVRKR